MDLSADIKSLKYLARQKKNYKASLFAIGLIESGIPHDDIVITRRKTDIENVPHEIENVLLKYPNHGNPYIEIETGKNGICKNNFLDNDD